MNETEARKILKDAIGKEDSLFGYYQTGKRQYFHWTKDMYQPKEITMDGKFSADMLEAISWWMNNKKEKTK